MSASEIDVRVRTDSSGVKPGMDKAAAAVKEGLDKIEKHFNALANPFERLKGLFAALTAVMAGGELGELAKKAGEFGDSIERASQKTGIATDELQGLRYAAQMSDVSFESLQKGLQRLSLKMAEAGNSASPVAHAFHSLGISAGEVKGMKVDEALAKIADKFAVSKDGAAKTAIAMTLFGRAGAELIPMLNKGSAGIEELKNKARELHLVIGEEGIAKLAAYDDQMKEIKAVHEAMAIQVGTALAPAMLQVTNAFKGSLEEGSPFKTFLEGLNEVITTATSLLSYLAQAFSVAGTSIGAASAMIGAALRGDWGQIKTIALDLDANIKRIDASYTKFREDLTKPLPTPKSANEGGHNKPTGNLNFSTGKAIGSGETLMAKLDAELAHKKAAIQKQNDLDGTFYEMSKAAEANFWKSKIALTDAGSKERYQIEKKYLDLKISLNKDGFEKTIANLKREEEAAKYDFDVKLKYAGEELKLIRQKFGEQSKEYEKGLAEIAKLERLKAEQSLKVQETIAASRTASLLAAVDLDEQQANIQVSLMQKSHAQMLADEREFENRRFEIKRAAIEERLQLPDIANNPIEKAKIDAQLEALEQQHQLKMGAIIGKGMQEDAKLSNAFFGSLQSGFANVLSGIVSGTMTIGSAMKQLFNSVLNAMSNMLANLAMKWLQTAIMNRIVGKTTAASEITGNAAVAGSGAFAATALIPYVGPALAPAAGAAAFAGAISYLGGLASAKGGFDVGAGVNPLTQLHEREMVLPAKHADVIRALADDGSGGSRQGGAVTVNIHATDAQSVKRLFDSNGEHIVAALRRQARNFNTYSPA